MPDLLFRLRGVPEDEAEDVRTLLNEHGIRYYETGEGNWKIAVPAIWLPDREQLEEARELIKTYQAERFKRARQEHEEQLAAGNAPTIRDRIRENPLRFVAYLAAAGVILYLSIMPFVSLGD